MRLLALCVCFIRESTTQGGAGVSSPACKSSLKSAQFLPRGQLVFSSLTVGVDICVHRQLLLYIYIYTYTSLTASGESPDDRAYSPLFTLTSCDSPGAVLLQLSPRHRDVYKRGQTHWLLPLGRQSIKQMLWRICRRISGWTRALSCAAPNWARRYWSHFFPAHSLVFVANQTHNAGCECFKGNKGSVSKSEPECLFANSRNAYLDELFRFCWIFVKCVNNKIIFMRGHLGKKHFFGFW